ncbi:MAG: hypothetical protein H0X46_06840, partial [Bacteroidetes bacterium]|nr:hypothetical protein [Bacteroidota bacterium]
AMAELGRLFKRKSSGGSSDSGGGKKKGKFKEVLKKGLHITNRLNPATAMLRAGILASAKLNVMKISSRLKYGYLSEDEAKKRGVDMVKFSRLKKVREKIEGIFYGAGGKPENLKKAILTGRGNRNHDVSGLGYTPDVMEGMNEYTPISRLLGTDAYQSELSEVVNGLGELGEPATAATIAAASGIVGAIAGLLKSIGSIFPKKDKASKDFEEGGSDAGGSDAGGETGTGDEGGESGSTELSVSKTNSPAKRMANSDEGGSDESQPGFWENNKKWIKPVGIGIGALGLLYAGYRIVSPKKPPAKQALTGVPKSRKPKKKGGKKAGIKSKKQKKEAVAFV